MSAVPNASARARFEREVRERVAPGAITAIAIDPRPAGVAARALGFALATLARRGVASGRCFVLVADGDESARSALAAHGLPVVVHDAARSRAFPAGRVAGHAVELDDELREAEAIVALGPSPDPAAQDPLPGAIVPALASSATREFFAAAGASEREAARALVRADAVLAWPEPGAVRAEP